MSVNGATVSIKPTNLLKDSTAYYVIISNTAIKDVAGNFFTGITASSDWNFKTLTPQISADIVEISDKQYIKFTNSTIFIATNESDYDFQITDLQGNIIKEKNKVQGELTINISEFEPALYILTYRTNGNFLQRKFVVQ